MIRSDCVEDNVLLGPLEDIRQARLVERVDHLGDVVVADRGDAHIVVRHIISRDTFGVRRGHISIRGYGGGEDRRGRGGGRTPQRQAPVNSTCNKRAPPRGGARGRGGSVYVPVVAIGEMDLPVAATGRRRGVTWRCEGSGTRGTSSRSRARTARCAPLD